MNPALRILAASPHCLVESASGAAVATLDALKLLTREGSACQALCASKLESAIETDLEQLLADLRLPARSSNLPVGDRSVRVQEDDLTRRALEADYRAVIAREAFVHHFGGRTFLGSGVDFDGLMREDQGSLS